MMRVSNSQRENQNINEIRLDPYRYAWQNK